MISFHLLPILKFHTSENWTEQMVDILKHHSVQTVQKFKRFSLPAIFFNLTDECFDLAYEWLLSLRYILPIAVFINLMSCFPECIFEFTKDFPLIMTITSPLFEQPRGKNAKKEENWIPHISLISTKTNFKHFMQKIEQYFRVPNRNKCYYLECCIVLRPRIIEKKIMKVVGKL